MEKIKLTNLCKQYGERIVLNQYGCEIIKGHTTCIMGGSGVGKTTLMRILLGLEQANQGKIEGLEKMSFSAVFQEDRLCEELDAITNVAMVLSKSVKKELMVEHLVSVGLELEELHKPVKMYSGGMKRRVAIVRGIMRESDGIIMDEPFKGLDEHTRSKVMEYVKVQTKGKTVIIITHDQEDAIYYGANVLKIKG